MIGDVSVEELVDLSFPILLKYGEFISAGDMKKKQFEFLAREKYSFVKNIVKEGVVLYERVEKTSEEGRREVKISKNFI